MNKLTKILLGIAIAVFALEVVMNVFFGVQYRNGTPFYIFSFLILILIPWIIQKIKKDLFIDYLAKNKNNQKLLIILLAGLIIGLLFIWIKGLSLLWLLPWAYFLFSFLYVFDSRISAIIAVTLLCYTLIFFMLRQIPHAKAIANLSYIFLIIMILTQVREYRLKKPKINE
jgi:hypothetical protein